MSNEIGLLPTVIEVARIVDITPRMRRITFAGHGVEVYASDPTRVPNIKLVFPRPNGELDLPDNDGTGRLRWPDPTVKQFVRTYTVRRLDPVAAEMDIDFVKHGDEGLASGWAEHARPGDRIGAAGGGGVVAPASDWYLIVGDETALPAIGRMLERLPEGARGVAVIEVADEHEHQELTSPADIEIRWVHRDGAPAGTTDSLLDAACAVAVPEGDVKRFAWVSAESRTVRAMRTWLRADGRFDRRSTLVIGYWHIGMSETGYGRSSDHDRVDDEHDDELS
ncbi:siderophore-interacting protein [Rhodococcus yananensis]|uniref:siderophore-interacting protein n=1 Tax=Rhodococcus yananensis TaxID=2879464 RepID=UPI001CF837AC|nr:siderophore-interacting protein [Rhodococcus yananensis]